MPTSSITHNFVVTNPDKFLQALEESERDITPKKKLSYKLLNDPKEISTLLKKRKDKLC